MVLDFSAALTEDSRAEAKSFWGCNQELNDHTGNLQRHHKDVLQRYREVRTSTLPVVLTQSSFAVKNYVSQNVSLFFKAIWALFPCCLYLKSYW